MPNKMIRRLLVALAGALPAGTAGARAQAPAEVVHEVLAAVDSQDWSRVVSLAHPAALERFRTEQVSLARMEEKSRTVLSVPARYRNQQPLYEIMYGVQSTDQLEAMPVGVMLAHYLSKQSGPAFYATAVRPPGAGPDGARALAQPRIVGTVMDGESVAYVVFSRPLGVWGEADSGLHAPREQAELMTLRRDGASWKVMLDGGLVFGPRAFTIVGAVKKRE